MLGVRKLGHLTLTLVMLFSKIYDIVAVVTLFAKSELNSPHTLSPFPFWLKGLSTRLIWDLGRRVIFLDFALKLRLCLRH